MFCVIPAIDVLDGRVVRLTQGDDRRVTVYRDDPVAQARAFVDAGARALHVVDLSAAFGRAGLSVGQVQRLAALGVPVQVGGGVRSLDAARRWLDAGARRVVVGSAVADPSLLAALARDVGPDKVAVSLDWRHGGLATHGWRTEAALTKEHVASQLRALGWRAVTVTAVDRDGTGRGPDLDLVAEWLAEGFQVTAAGGIRGAEDIRALRRIGAAGVIVGRALYDGSLVGDAAAAVLQC